MFNQTVGLLPTKMQLAGIQKTTLVDYPGKIAATIFLRGCNFRCGFCHNPELVIPEQFLPLIDESELFRFLESRLGKLQGVCITGGEPLLWGDTVKLISHIKALGYATKLDTNGSYPERLAEIIKEGDLGYVAMDIKSTLDKYPMLINPKIQDTRYKQIPNSKSKIPNNETMKQSSNGSNVISSPLDCSKGEKSQNHVSGSTSVLVDKIQQSIDLIMSSGLDYEFRTTVAKPLHEPDDFIDIGKMIKGSKRFYIQNFVRSKHINEHINFNPFSEKELKLALNNVSPFVALAAIR